MIKIKYVNKLEGQEDRQGAKVKIVKKIKKK